MPDPRATAGRGFDEPARADVRIGLCEQLGLVLRSIGEMTVAASSSSRWRRSGLGRRPRRRRGEGVAYAASALSWFDRQRCLRAAERAERLPVVDPCCARTSPGYAAYARLIWNAWSPSDAEACARAAEVTRAVGRHGALRLPRRPLRARAGDARRLRGRRLHGASRACGSPAPPPTPTMP